MTSGCKFSRMHTVYKSCRSSSNIFLKRRHKTLYHSQPVAECRKEWSYISTCLIHLNVGRDSVVGIATRYRVDGRGIESLRVRDFVHPSRPAPGPIQSPVQWVPGPFSGSKGGGGVPSTTHPSSAEVKERVELYLYSPSGSSWSVPGQTLPSLLLFTYALTTYTGVTLPFAFTYNT